MKTGAQHSKILPLVKRLIPWFVAAVILVFLFYRVDGRHFVQSMQVADLSMYAPWLVVFCLAWFFFDVQNIQATVNNYGYTVSFRDIMSMRGVTYLLMIVDYTLGMGGMVLYLKNDKNIPIVKSTGLMMVYTGVTQFSLFIMAAIGCWLGDMSKVLFRTVFATCVSLAAVYVAAIIVIKLLPEKGRVGRFKNLAIVKLYHEVSWQGYVSLIVWRIAYYATYILFYYIAMPLFGMHVPIEVLITAVPLILLVISFPVTPFGLGTAQAAMLFLFKGYGTEAAILAFGITYSTSIVLIRGLIGLFYVKKISGLMPGKLWDSKEMLNEKI
ncbi:MAG: hypothetical protein CVV44_21035 [Spirochaetae bacterium HGW-Spirochaetae-1]|jgi:uncharacterized membrane protein YbhN (UPF0104 family)|nr:MAG: hypothetical protein CVV44_21035 [Spirochaetae bacterium HGW-Spirochaetae-1]